MKKYIIVGIMLGIFFPKAHTLLQFFEEKSRLSTLFTK
jgi:hypothetical protein